MQSFLCRVMVVIFAFYCLLPAPSVLAQTSSKKPSFEELMASIQQAQKNVQAMDQAIQRALQQYEEAESLDEIREAISLLHIAGKEKEKQEMKIPGNARWGYSDGEDVLQKIKSPDFTLDQLVDMIDPYLYNQSYYLSTAYAAEVFGNSIEAIDPSSLDEETKTAFLELLPRVQLRILYRLQKIEGEAPVPTTVNDVMARGSLRIVMWKIHEFYKAMGEENPIETYIPSSLEVAPAPVQSIPFYSIENGKYLLALNQALAEANRKMGKKEKVDIFADMRDRYLWELKQFKKMAPKSDSTNFQLMLLTADYATMFFILSGGYPPHIVDIFDEGKFERFGSWEEFWNGPQFEQTYSALFYQVMQTMYQTAKYSKGVNVGRALSFLKTMSDPEIYSIPVRIFALEAAGKLVEKKTVCPVFSADDPAMSAFYCNSYEMDPRDQAMLAARAVDLYYPLQSTHYAGMQDYGLDSQQMKELSDQLVSIYNSFSNDRLHVTDKTPYCADFSHDTNGNLIVLNSATSIPRIEDIRSGYMTSCIDGWTKEKKLVVYGGMGRDSRGYWHKMETNNGYNRKKKEDEAMALFARIAGEAFLWYVGGELIGVAWRGMKGTMVAIGPMTKAFNGARKGRKLQAAGIQLKKSIRYQNIAHAAQASGTTIAYGRASQVANPKNLPILASEATSTATATVTEVVTSTRKLAGRKFFQFLRKPKAPITQIEVGVQLPGFQFAGARVAESAIPRLSKGVRNLDDWKYLTRNLVDAAGNPIKWAELNPAFSWNPLAAWTNPIITQLERENELYYATFKGMNQGRFNYWAHTADGWVRVDAATFGKMGKELKAAEAFVPDYYAVLGVKPTATASELKAAHRRLATKWHPDKPTGNPQKMAELNEAWGVLGDATKRAAYDAKFTAQGSVAAQNTFGLSQAENGFSLAITRDLGAAPSAGLGKGFDPVKAHNGLGFNATNWTEGYSYQLTGHLAATKQLDVLGENLITSTQFWRGYGANLTFFTAWRGLDYATYNLGFKNWLVKAQTADHQAEADKYGDLFKPQDQSADGNSEPVDNGLELYNKVSAAVQDNSEGYFIVAPIILARRGLSNIGIGDMSFVSDKDKALYESAANRLRLNQAIIEGNKAQNKETLRKTYEAVITETGPEFRQFLKQEFELVPNGNAMVDRWADGYQQEMKDIYESDVDDATKYKQMGQAVEKWADELHGMYLQALYTSVEFNSSENVKMQLYIQFMALPDAITIIEKWQSDYRQEAAYVYNSSKTNEEKLNALTEVIIRYNGKLDSLSLQADQAMFDAHKEEYQANVEIWAQQAAQYDKQNGEKEVREIWNEYFQKLDKLINSDKTREEKMGEWNTLFQTYYERFNTYISGIIPEEESAAMAGQTTAEELTPQQWQESMIAEINAVQIEVEQIVASWSSSLKQEALDAVNAFVKQATEITKGEGSEEEKGTQVFELFEKFSGDFDQMQLKHQYDDELLPPSETDSNTQAY